MNSNVTKRVPLWAVASLLVLMILLASQDEGVWRWIEILAAAYLGWMLWTEWRDRRDPPSSDAKR